jgi:gem associated protein 2
MVPVHLSENELKEAYAESESDEEFNLQQFGIRQALPVDDAEPDFSSAEPATVEEYLRRVRHEARQLPSVVMADVKPRENETNVQVATPPSTTATPPPDCRQDFKPSDEWILAFLKEFAALRRRLLREADVLADRIEGTVLRVNDPAALPVAAQAERAALELDSPSWLMPELAELRGLDQVAIVQRLLRTVQRMTASDVFVLEDASMLYALSARVEKPLHGSTAAAYRALLRRCCEWRAETKERFDPLLPHLNVLIVLAGAYFGQDESLSALFDDEVVV